jgi:crotonobetainyl-CoA:carnitine CoA-transferase CaiB-like acyl-CoA transferase
VAGEVPGLAGDHHPAIAPYGMFETGTAPIQIACGSEGLWKALCTALDLDPADERFASNPLRVEHRDELIALLEAHFATDPAEHWLDMLSSAGVPSGKVRSLDDVYSWEQTQSQGLLVSVPHETLGSVDLPGSPIRFDDNPFSGGRSEHLAPPTLGQHDQSIRDWLDS